MALSTGVGKYLFEALLLIHVDMYPEVELLHQMLIIILIFLNYLFIRQRVTEGETE